MVRGLKPPPFLVRLAQLPAALQPIFPIYLQPFVNLKIEFATASTQPPTNQPPAELAVCVCAMPELCKVELGELLPRT